MKIGIVGLPNVGKSTLFNALLRRQQALVANYPFATIEPNVGVVEVKDPRLDKLAEITKEENKMSDLPPKIYATVSFVDIAGLVKGASEGAGLGNKFLSHIREVEVIAHVVRDFEDSNIIREGSVSAKDDYEAIRTELILADLQTMQNMNEKALRTDPHKGSAVSKLKEGLNSGKSAADIILTDEEKDSVKELNLLSAKPELIVINVSEDEYRFENLPTIIKKHADSLGLPEDKFVVICAKIESELSDLSEDDQRQYLLDLGLESSGLERLIAKAYDTLGLQSFLTAGVKEVKAWTIKKGTTAQNAAGEIHTDFIKKFIKAEIVGFEDFVSNNGWKGSREAGKARVEGRDYIMHDGDVVEFKIGT